MICFMYFSQNMLLFAAMDRDLLMHGESLGQASGCCFYLFLNGDASGCEDGWELDVAAAGNERVNVE